MGGYNAVHDNQSDNYTAAEDAMITPPAFGTAGHLAAGLISSPEVLR